MGHRHFLSATLALALGGGLIVACDDQESPNLAKQLRRVLDREDWAPNVMPDRYVRITDFDAGPSARLLIDYCP